MSIKLSFKIYEDIHSQYKGCDDFLAHFDELGKVDPLAQSLLPVWLTVCWVVDDED